MFVHLQIRPERGLPGQDPGPSPVPPSPYPQQGAQLPNGLGSHGSELQPRRVELGRRRRRYLGGGERSPAEAVFPGGMGLGDREGLVFREHVEASSLLEAAVDCGGHCFRSIRLLLRLPDR